MTEFIAGQRWISETEPEIGLGTILSTDNRIVEIIFSANETKRKYSIRNAPLKRVKFRPGDKIQDKKGNTLLIDKLEEKDELIHYHCNGKVLIETELSDKISITFPEERLFSGQTDENYLFGLRYESLLLRSIIKSSEISGLIGPRLDLIPHQFFIANEVTNRYYPRILLADEVGLGKTIEAGLIIHKLLLNERIERVLIITPEPLVNQWFVEMLRRFNLIFVIVDEDSCLEMEKANPGINPFLENQLVICSLSFLTSSELRQKQAIDSGWDLMTVDEAHHLTWTPEKASPEYSIVEKLSNKVKSLLLLTATPEQLGIVSHFARLRLLDPDRFFDLETFIREIGEYSQIAEVVQHLIEKVTISIREQEILINALGYSHELIKQLDEIKKGNETERKKLIETMIDQHGTSRILFRNTRSVIPDFPRRIVKPEPLVNNPDKPENPKLEWLVELLQTLGNEKVLLICSSKKMIMELEESIRSKISVKTAMFHENLSLLARDRNAAYFSEPDGANILLCSEIGSEGRNFQFSHNLVLYDLPLNIDLLEQRIGRLDRIGQKYEINIYVPYIKDSSEEVLFEIYHNALNAFETFPKGGTAIFSRFYQNIKTALENPYEVLIEKRTELDILIENMQIYKQDLYEKLERSRDRLLEYNSFRPETGKAFTSKISKTDGDIKLEEFMNRIFEHFGIESEDISTGTYFVSPSNLMFVETFPRLSLNGTMITYNRKYALEREDIEFITREHPMVTESIDLLLSSGQGNSSVVLLKDSNESIIILESVFILECVAPKELYVDRFLTPMPVRILVNNKLEQVHLEMGEINSTVLNLNPDKVFSRPEISKLVKIMLDKTNELAECKAQEIIKISLEKMNNSLEYEAKRLIDLKKVNPNVTEKEIEFAQKQIVLLNENISSSRLRIDSLRLICSDPDEW